MSVATPLYTLLKSNFRGWVSAKGFWLVAAAALLPLVLTGAWVQSHTADLVLTDLRVEPANPADGDAIRIIATIRNVGETTVSDFNATMSIHPPPAKTGDSVTLPFPVESKLEQIDKLLPGESREVVLNWTATAGAFAVIAQADSQTIFGRQFQEITDKIPERDEYNNYQVVAFEVAAKTPTNPPAPPAGLAGDANASTDVDLVVESITRSSAAVKEGENVTFTVIVRNNGLAIDNATVVVRVGQGIGARLSQVTEQRQNVSFDTGETKTVDVVWISRVGSWWHEGYALPPADTRDVNPDDNRVIEGFAVDTTQKADTSIFQPQPKATIKTFYLDVLTRLTLPLLVPLIALFYATGVISDERERGSLAYIITRPIPRWLIPITKFIASFAVAAAAMIIGVVITYAFLFGATVEGRDVGYLTTPLLATLLALFAYGGLFTFIGTWIDRPYLVGLGYILAGIVLPVWSVPFVRNAGLPFHLQNALSSWKLDEGLQWLPQTPEALRAFYTLIGIGVGFLVLAGVQMRRREFIVG